ncbi:MAG: ATP-binding protein [Arcobacter sp.]|uniref:ATP-binding protein n=1 Tax=Arcobacter sp. TaxID=1872629 RepID=UPI003B0076AA
MSFKYRFILSFVLLEIFFIVLIVSINFFTISNSSKKLINERIDSNITFLEQLVKVPISIYDIATLDDLVENSTKYMNSFVLLDNNDKVLSSQYLYEYMSLKELIKLKTNRSIEIEKESYEIIYKELFEDEIRIGSMYVIFDTSASSSFIENNKNKTLLIIFIEIFLSTIISYLIGHSLTKKLTKLSEIASEIGKDKQTNVPYTNSKDEIGILAQSMYKMQNNLNERKSIQREYTKALRKQRFELMEANKSKDNFLANMSHELKTPLNSINVISEVMMRNKTDNLDIKQVKNLEIINKCGKDLLFIINDVLDISKLEAGQLILNYDKINIKELIKSVYDMFYLQVKIKNLDFILKIDDNLDLIYSDENRIKQIIKNLLSNALKFTSKGKISLIAKDENKNLKIIVKDEGIGIPEDKLEYIFDRFKQADGTTTRHYGGTGLGLSICNELALLLKGSITVTSELEKGSSFEFVISKNEDLIVGLDLLEFGQKNEKKTFKDEKKEVILTDEIYVLNSNPILFFKIVNQLKTKYNIININSLKEIDLNKEIKVILEVSRLSDDDILFIKEKNIDNLILIYKDKIDNDLEKFAHLCIEESENDFDYTLI